MINTWLSKTHPVQMDIMVDMHVRECLTKSSPHLICVDNLTQGFVGMACWESLSKGQAVIARLDPDVEEGYKRIGGGTCPIINVSGMDEMCRVIRELSLDRERLKAICMEGRQWMETYYTTQHVINMYLELYEKAMA